MNLHHALAVNPPERGLADLTQRIGNCVDNEAVFAVLRQSLRSLVRYDLMAVYLCRGERLIPECLDGDDYRLFASLNIPLGIGLSGWVAENRKPIMNGNPSVEPGYLNDPTKFSALRSALAIPLESEGQMVDVLSLYRLARDSFSPGNLTHLLLIGESLALALGHQITRLTQS
jgi:GAF domain-containing protein